MGRRPIKEERLDGSESGFRTVPGSRLEEYTHGRYGNE
jgi:hypothetical protein